jgi:hypothetical protein
MDCKQTKNLLFEFIDNELGQTAREQVEEHLKSCSSCREYEQWLRTSVIEPLRHTEELKAPEGIWEKIEEKIISEEKSFSLRGKILNWLKNFEIPSPVYAGAGLLVAILALTLLLRQPEKSDDTVSSYIQDQLQFFSQLENKGGITEPEIKSQVSETPEKPLQQAEGEENYLRLDDVNLGTTIEKYFL